MTNSESYAHSKHDQKIIRREEAKFLNKYHEKLSKEFGENRDSYSKHDFKYLLDIE